MSDDMKELGQGKEDISNRARGLKAAMSNPSMLHLSHLLSQPYLTSCFLSSLAESCTLTITPTCLDRKNL